MKPLRRELKMLVSFMTEYFPGILMLIVFLIMMAGMYSRKISALLALPIMAFLFALIGVVRYVDLFSLAMKYMGEKSFILLLWSKAVWFVILTALVYLTTRKKISAGAAVLAALISFLIMLILNISGLSRIMGFSILGQLLDCLQSKVIIKDILADGAVKLTNSYTVAIFGGMLAILVKEKKIAETFIKYAAELAGDNPVYVAIIMMFVCFTLFTTLGGLGAIIMIGTIILPIMMSLGIEPLVAGGVLLIGLCAGGTFNPGNWALYEASLGVETGKVQLAAIIMIVMYLGMGCIFIIINTRGRRRRRYFASGNMEYADAGQKVHPAALLSPIVPIFLVLRTKTFVDLLGWVKGWSAGLDSGINFLGRAATFWDAYIGGWEFIPAFIAGILFCLFTTWDKKGDNIKMLTKAMIEGAESVMPAVLLMLGIGMLLNAVWNPDVGRYLDPVVRGVIPSTRIPYILIFGLCAPLALYRGPLNLWGLGLGVASLIYKGSPLSAAAVMGIFITTGAMQGICDPTNTHNVWIATYINEDVIKLTKKLLIYVWAMIFVGLLLMSVLFPLNKTPQELERLSKSGAQSAQMK